MKRKIKILQTLIIILYFAGIITTVYHCVHSSPYAYIAIIFGIFIILLATILMCITIYTYNLAKSIEKDITSILYRKEYVTHTKYYPQNSIICKSKDK